jgi:hypothetical protein
MGLRFFISGENTDTKELDMSRNVKNGIPSLVGFLAFVFVAAGLIVGGIFAAAGNTEHGWSVPKQTTVTSSNSSAVRIAPQDLTGIWESDNPEAKFVATITNDAIDIDLQTSSGTLAYWSGSFGKPEGSTNKIKSNPDPGRRITWSNAATKEFLYLDGTLAFDYMAPGITSSIVLHRR